MVKVCLRGECKDIKLSTSNGVPARCVVRVEMDHDIPLTFDLYDVQLFVPTEFATLFEVGHPLTLTLEQHGTESRAVNAAVPGQDSIAANSRPE
jgi:hypothetical protein